MRKHLHNSSSAPAGFTLVEMLVATALVLLIMLLFASIYGAAVGTITEQRGLANVDSKARTIDSLIRRDLEKMTFRQLTTAGTKGIVPLAPGDEVDPRQVFDHEVRRIPELDRLVEVVQEHVVQLVARQVRDGRDDNSGHHP